MNEERKIEIEEVEAVAKPPRAVPPAVAEEEPVEAGGETTDFERKRDYLAGFLAQKANEEPGAADPGADLYERVIAALQEIYDPEIPVNIYDLGLIYEVKVSADGDAKVVMTLTTPHCPVAESMPGEVELRVLSVPGVRDAEVELVWDPPWDPQKMSDEAKLELGML
jgi:FeS assembly SUF system protein